MRRKRNGLDFNNTCPIIDESIKKLKEIIRDAIDQQMDTIVDAVYDNLNSEFEKVRTTNEDMRKQADYQIEELTCIIDNLESKNQSQNTN